MNRRILLAVDTSIAPATRQALLTVSALLEQASTLDLILLNVIPLPYSPTPSLGMYVGQIHPLPIAQEQRSEAEDALRRARVELQKYHISPDRVESVIRVGEPAHEIVKLARECNVELIVVGTRGEATRQKIRRFLVGSISRRVLHLTPCPIMLVMPPPVSRPGNLVVWYERSLDAYLREHTNALAVFTPREVATLFTPPGHKKIGRKEIAAATLALEALVNHGTLCRHEVKGQLRYVND